MHRAMAPTNANYGPVLIASETNLREYNLNIVLGLRVEQRQIAMHRRVRTHSQTVSPSWQRAVPIAMTNDATTGQ